MKAKLAARLARLDSCAVVFIPAADAARVITAAEEIAAREAAMVRAIRAGKRLPEVLGAAYEHMLKK